MYLLPWVAVNYQQHTSVCHNFSLFLAFQFYMPSANKQVSWPQNVDVLPLFNLLAMLRGAQHLPPLPPTLSLGLSLRTSLGFAAAYFILPTWRHDTRVLYMLSLFNYSRSYNFNNLPFKWAETLMFSPLLPMFCAWNPTHSFGYASRQGHLLDQGLHVMV